MLEADVFWSRVERLENGCWMYRNPRGRYAAEVREAAPIERMSTMSYALHFMGQPKNTTSKKRCGNKACCNPAHIGTASVAVTLAVKSRVAPNGCVEWIGALDKDGYGRISVGRTTRRAHRMSYEVAKGEIPDGLVIDHLCRNRACINPDHMEPVVTRVNTLRGENFIAKNAKKTHCLRGHELSGPNLIINRDRAGRQISRWCRICDNAKQRATYHRREERKRLALANSAL